MAFDFPGNPTFGQEYADPSGISYVWNGQGWEIKTGGSTVESGVHTVSDTPPTDPGQGDIWLESDTMVLWMWYDDGAGAQWVQINGTGGTGGGTITPPPEPVDAYTRAESDARFEPIDSAYTKAESDAIYMPVGYAYSKADANYINAQQDANISNRVLRSGDTMTGSLSMNVSNQNAGFSVNTYGTGSAAFSMNRPHGNRAVIASYTSGVSRWGLLLGDTAGEGGGDTGSNFSIERYGDTGNILGTVFSIRRNNGDAEFYNSLFVKYIQSGTAANYWTTDGTLVITGLAYKPGGGMWLTGSDARIKNVVGDYEHGLSEIVQLSPVRYTYKGNEALREEHVGTKSEVEGKEFIGLVAQTVEGLMPELVTQGNGFIDGAAVTDLRTLDATPLIYALINAVKELKTTNDALTARVAALEGTA